MYPGRLHLEPTALFSAPGTYMTAEICFADLAPLSFSVVKYLPKWPAICFYYLGECICLRVSIIINKAMRLASLPVSHSAGPLVNTLRTPIIDENKDNRPPFRSSCAHAWHTRTCIPPAFAASLLPWLSVLVPITDNNYRQSPCVSITSRHNALIRPGLI